MVLHRGSRRGFDDHHVEPPCRTIVQEPAPRTAVQNRRPEPPVQDPPSRTFVQDLRVRQRERFEVVEGGMRGQIGVQERH